MVIRLSIRNRKGSPEHALFLVFLVKKTYGKTLPAFDRKVEN